MYIFTSFGVIFLFIWFLSHSVMTIISLSVKQTGYQHFFLIYFYYVNSEVLGNHSSNKVTKGGSQNKQDYIGKADSDGRDSRGWSCGGCGRGCSCGCGGCEDTKVDAGHVGH